MTNLYDKNNNIAKKVAYGGIVNLLTIVSLYLASILPTNRLLFFGLSSIFLAIVVIEFGTKFAFINFISASILGLILVYNKLILVPYILFFGYYGIVKYIIEKINNIVFEWILKLLIYNCALYLIFLFTIKLLMEDIKVNLPIWVLIILVEVVFIAYDFGFSVAISYYKDKIKKIIK